MKAITNETVIAGVLYQHDLKLKTTGPNSKNPGTDFISGYVDIATDDAMTNIVRVNYRYVTAVTSKGNNNKTFTTLENIISGAIPTYMAAGDKAAKVNVKSAVGLNEFYSNRTGEDILVSNKCNQGGFINTVDVIDEDEKTRAIFKCDILITKVTRYEADEENNLPERLVIKGCTFDFMKALLPIELVAYNPIAIAYFEDADISDKSPMFTCVWGRQVSTVVKKEIRTESAFGDDEVRVVTNSRKEWVVTGSKKEPYVWDDESTLTAVEVSKAITDRNTYLATMKQRNDEWREQANKSKTASTMVGPIENFNF